jgi:hypothetical protein
MIYAFDNSPLSVLFRNYYRRRFPTLWQRFDDLVDSVSIVSTREVLREIQDGAVESLRDWAGQNLGLFTTPSAEEGLFVARIYAVAHFQQNIERQKLLRGGRNADPFIIAKAAVAGCTVVTMEQRRPNGVKIPNICNHFGIPWMTLEEFMESEGWEF